MKKVLALVFTMLVVVLGFSAVANPDTFFFATLSEPDTLDPHYAYDTSSSEVLYNVYESLLGYKGSSLTQFEPRLATKWSVSKDGKTYTFTIRKGVKFHNGETMEPSDVEYSFERGLLFDPTNGPMWMICDPLLGFSTTEDAWAEFSGVAYDKAFDPQTREVKAEYKEKAIEFYKKVIDPVVEVKGDTVVFSLKKPFGPFLNVIAQSATWASVMSKDWSVKIGLWNGKEDGWWKYHNLKKEDSPVYAKANGTGPYMFKEWDRAQQKYTLVSFADYWRAPAKIKTIVVKGIDEFGTRKAMLEKGEADLIAIGSTAYVPQFEGKEGIQLIKGISRVQSDAIVFNWTIKSDKYIGSAKLDGNGIPADFFKDENVRRGFAYLFNNEEYIKDAIGGFGIEVPTALPTGLLGYDKSVKGTAYDLEEAAKYFKRAYKGQLWSKGFKIQMLYNTGNAQRQKAAEMIRDALAKINAKFKVEVLAVQWPTFLDARKNGLMPLYTAGWLADYPDPHNFIFTFYHSSGDYGRAYGENYKKFAEAKQAFFSGKSLNDMIEEAAAEANASKRHQMYVQIQKFVVDNAIGVAMDQGIAVRVQREWVKGWYPNAVRPGEDFYALDK